ncbi:MAG TPA: 16S rRNA (guanine(527)-N(7))-methyltransferase RsmG [Sphingobium sp.]
MTEEDARAWLAGQGYGVDAIGRLDRLVDLVVEENTRQNLISASTVPHMWSRHIVDSAQLLALALADRADEGGLWADLGSGGGFPGLVIACLREAPLLLVETRGLRARFLENCLTALGLGHANVKQAKVERVTLERPASYISARAFAPLDRTFDVANHLCDENTLWLLPKGRSAQIELVSARQEWQAAFHVEQSVTDAESAIIVAKGLKRRRHGRSGTGKSVGSRKA